MGDIYKPPVEKPTGTNLYQNGRGGIGKFVVPKFTIPPPAQENRLWTGSTPGHCKTGKEGTDRPIAGMERASRRDTLGRKVGS